MLWKHTDWRTDQTEVRRSRRLVVSFIATVGNYEYGFYWYFYQDGSIQCEVKLTGIMNTTGPAARARPRPTAPRSPAAQRAVSTSTSSTPASTWTSTAPSNSVYEVNTVGAPPGPDNPHGNAFFAEATLLLDESEAQRTTERRLGPVLADRQPGEARTRLGRPVGYRLVPGENCPAVRPAGAAAAQAGRLPRAATSG